MVSGKYSALAGAISREQAIATVSNNLANINTTGYKKNRVSFESLLQGTKQESEKKGINLTRIRQNFNDFTPGAIKSTEDPFDVAINGEGFFKVEGKDSVLFTRRGDFTVDENGLLTTRNGLPVLDDSNTTITIPDTDTSTVAFGEDGTIFVLGRDGSRSEVGKLALVDIEDKSKLKREQDTTYSLASGSSEIEAENATIVQGSVELSNVNMAEELSRMIDNQRTFETYHNVLKSYSTIGEQLEELGTLA